MPPPSSSQAGARPIGQPVRHGNNRCNHRADGGLAGTVIEVLSPPSLWLRFTELPGQWSVTNHVEGQGDDVFLGLVLANSY